jgi:hypothetical protein
MPDGFNPTTALGGSRQLKAVIGLLNEELKSARHQEQVVDEGFGPPVDIVCRSGTESSQTPRWRGESRANQSLKVGFSGAGELRPNSETFMDDTGSVRAPFSGRISRNFGFVPRPTSLVMSS